MSKLPLFRLQAALVHQRTSLQKKIHHAAQNKRVRFNEFFKDFDRLRTGEITGTSFVRHSDVTKE